MAFLKISSRSESVKSLSGKSRKPWSAPRQPSNIKYFRLTSRARIRSWKSFISKPAASDSLEIYPAYSSPPSTAITLSGRHEGRTFMLKVPSWAMALCHLRSSAGSSVVQSTRTFILSSSPLTENPSSRRSELHLSYILRALPGLSGSVMPKYL